MQADAIPSIISDFQSQAAALRQGEPSGDFNDIMMGQVSLSPQPISAADLGGASGGASANGSSGGYQLSGSFQSGYLIAVGSVGSDGQVTLFPQAQIQSEQADVAQMQQSAFSDSLQNFMTLAQESETNGQIGASTYSDQQSFTGDNGLISSFLDTTFSLTPTTNNDSSSA